jgi:hypothetical protein
MTTMFSLATTKVTMNKSGTRTLADTTRMILTMVSETLVTAMAKERRGRSATKERPTRPPHIMTTQN